MNGKLRYEVRGSPPLKRVRRGIALTGFFAGMLLTTFSAQAAVTQFVAGMSTSGSPPFSGTCGNTPYVPGDDACGSDNIVRTHDYVGYRVGYSVTPEESNILVTLTIPEAVIPTNYVLTDDPKVASFSYLDLPTGSNGCRGIQSAPVSDPPANGVSGITADGQKLFCWQPSPSSANNLDFRMRIAGTAPNGTIQPAPMATLTTNTGVADATPLNTQGPTANYYGLPDVIVSAAPRWDLVKSNSYRGAILVPRSGPNGEDGLVFSWNIGVRATGSIKGLEALNSAKFTENYSDANPGSADLTGPGNFANSRLVTWSMVNPDFTTNTNVTTPSTLAGLDAPVGSPRNCGNWQSSLQVITNQFDNIAYYPYDAGALSTAASGQNAVSRGGECVMVPGTNNTSAKTATFELIGTDYSLNHYPTLKGTAGTVTLVNTSNLDQATNEFWVSSKTLLVWAPVTDITIVPPATQQTDFLTNRVSFEGKSVTGQDNVEPETTNSNVHVQAGDRRLLGAMSKVHAPWSVIWANPNGWDVTTQRDPNITTDTHINAAAPNQYFVNRMIIGNSGTETIAGGFVCDRLDNTRTSFVDARSIPLAPAVASNSRYQKDPKTGIVSFWSSGPISGFTPVYHLGVGGTGIVDAPSFGGSATSGSGTWESTTTVSNPYLSANVNTGSMATSGCGDTDATWFESIDDLLAAGYTVQDVSRVRMSYNQLLPAAGFYHWIPSRVNATTVWDTAMGVVDGTYASPGTPVAANTSTVDMMSTNIAGWRRNDGFATTTPNSFEIYQNEFAQITKSSPTHPNNSLVTPGSVVTYRLQANLSTSGSAHTTDVYVYDVLPLHMSYVAGSTTIGGVVGAEPVCTAGPAPWPTGWGQPGVAPADIPAGFHACQWTLPAQTATKVAPGNVNANLPAVQFRARVSTQAPGGAQLLNTSFADSTKNSMRDARYGGEKGFACVPNQFCSFSNWLLTVNAAPGAVLNKTVSADVVPTETGFSYQLQYGAIGNALEDLRIVDVLPYNADGRTPASNYVGTLGLTGAVAGPAVSLEGGADDADVRVLYTSNAHADIKTAPYDPSHILDGTGTNSPTSTNWCANIGGNNCPTTWADVTGIYVFAKDQVNIEAGEAFALTVNMAANGNAVGNIYSNSFTGDSPSLTARNPGSNIVTTRVVGPDLAIAKKVNPSKVTAGGTVNYEVIVRNDGTDPNAGPFISGNITVSDTLPEGVSMIGAAVGTNWTCSNHSAVLFTCTYEGSYPIPTGATVGGPITFEAQVVSNLTGLTQSFTNTATVRTPTTEVKVTNNDASATFTAEVPPQIGAYKRITAGPTSQGNGTWSVTYEVGARNYGPQDVTAFNLTDSLIGTAPAFGSHVAATPTAAGTYTVTGGASSCTLVAGAVVPGVVYAANASFNGDSVTQLLSAPTTLPGSTASTAGEVKCSFTVLFAPTAGQTHFENTVVASGSANGIALTDSSFNGSDPKGGNANEAPTSTANNVPTPLDITRQVQPAVAKTASITQFTEGDVTPLIYTIVVRNTGPDGLNGFTVVDTPAAGITVGAWSCAVTTAGNAYLGVTTACGAASGNGTLNTTADLQPGAVVTYTVNASIGASVMNEATNTAAVTAPDTTGVGCVTNCSVNSVSTVTNAPRQVQPTITKAVNATDYQPLLAKAVTYTIVVGNSGIHGGNGFAVQDVPPAGVTIGSWTCAVTTEGATYAGVTTACGAASGTGALSTTANLQPGAVLTYTLLADIAADATGNLVNTATNTAPDGAQCANGCVVQDEATVSALPFGALTVLKSVDKTSYVFGSKPLQVKYTVVVTNNSAAPVIGATVADTQPADVTFDSWTCAVTAAGSSAVVTNACAATGSGSIADTVTLNPGAVLTYTVEATIAETVREEVVNIAIVTLPPNQCTTSGACSVESSVTTKGTSATTPIPAGGPLSWLLMMLGLMGGGWIAMRRHAMH